MAVRAAAEFEGKAVNEQQESKSLKLTQTMNRERFCGRRRSLRIIRQDDQRPPEPALNRNAGKQSLAQLAANASKQNLLK